MTTAEADTMTTYKLNPMAEPPEEPSVEGTKLTDQARVMQEAAKEKKKGGKKKTKLQVLAEKVREVDGYVGFTDLRGGMKSMADALADVQSFNDLIDDRKVVFGQLRPVVLDDKVGAGNFRMLCDHPPRSEQGHADESMEDLFLNMRPTETFLRGVARYANEGDRTPVRGLTGTFLHSLIRADHAGRTLASDAILYILRFLVERHTYKDEDGNVQHKPVLLRTLRPDSKGRWPKLRSCRALLHENFRDDISHLWLMKVLHDWAPTANIVRYGFDGDLLRGAILLPSIAREEKDSAYGGGLFFFSGEVGNRRCGARPFIYRTRNQGVTIIGKQWGVTHAGSVDLDRLHQRFESFVHKQIPLVTVSIERLIRSQDITFDESVPFTLERLLLALGLTFSSMSQQDLRLWRVAAEAERNLVPGLALSVFTLQNGLVRMSQSVEDPVRQIQLDTIAGQLLDVEWDKIAARADTVSADQVKKTFPA